MGDNDDAMRALMGFVAFGRPRKRTRRGGKFIHATDRSESRRQSHDVHHVVPGTIVQADGERVPAARLRIAPHGIATLLHPWPGLHQDDVSSLEDITPSEQQPQRGTFPTSANAWSLPSTSIELLALVEATKARFEHLEPAAFALARRRANPFEQLGRHRFINRSAMKMANLDFLFQWTQRAARKEDAVEPFVFADVCGGPGGFSEYLLWKMKGNTEQHESATQQSLAAVGFGITLKGAPWCDWKVTAAEAAPAAARIEFHICDGADGTGDLYKIANIHCFRDTLLDKYPTGAHLVVADGGFPDARDQSNQELLMTRLIVAETLTMFHVLRVGGSFVCKTFELSSPVMLQLFWLLHGCFEEITIVKPVTSRPASSERYIVATNLLPNRSLPAIHDELARLVKSLETKDPLDEYLTLTNAFTSMAKPTTWLDFVAQASDRHARQQIKACETIIALATPSSPSERVDVSERRIDRDEYYHVWQLL